MATPVIRYCALLALMPTLVAAQEWPPWAYQLAAASAQVPPTLLYAVALQETGKMLRGRTVPWPWTLNIADQPHRYATRRQACQALQHALQSTPQNRIDVGLAQLNVGYQGDRVSHPCELLEPYRNLRLAAMILREQYNSNESWLMAAGRYHRPAGGVQARRYRQAVERYMATLGTQSQKSTR
ncbi:hypothetical protein SAMN04490182_1998 [Pseudomonas cedrina]|uniref:Lytic transglycosylase n=2 Tax=Pseudomonas cedrina TaxID=651740 RepID=A0A1V2K1D9_PSECE|nr:lytic transglycosylase [Pseudomonas cedrina]ONH50906.1 lytic transglycosylase [Pseudomonas cedrina subsp. cedrina]SDS63033.1 hypothetical protein SAMN04490182_1998 [Pseudomonas cedrina]